MANIEIVERGLVCDNPNCDYENNGLKFEDYEAWVNKPCPKCGENLLTEQDYLNAGILRFSAMLINDMTEEELSKLNGKVDMDELKKNKMFSDTKGLENLTGEGLVTMTVTSHKEIKVEEIKKL